MHIRHSIFRFLPDPVDSLWVDVYSTYDGLNDKIPIEANG